MTLPWNSPVSNFRGEWPETSRHRVDLQRKGEEGNRGGQGFGRFAGEDWKEGGGGRREGESAIELVDACEEGIRHIE